MVKVMLAIFVGLLRRRPLPNAGEDTGTGEFAGVAPRRRLGRRAPAQEGADASSAAAARSRWRWRRSAPASSRGPRS